MSERRQYQKRRTYGLTRLRLYQQARRAAKKEKFTSVNSPSTDVNNVNPLAVDVSVAVPVDTSTTTARDRFLAQVPRRYAWDAECKALLAGMRGPAPTLDTWMVRAASRGGMPTPQKDEGAPAASQQAQQQPTPMKDLSTHALLEIVDDAVQILRGRADGGDPIIRKAYELLAHLRAGAQAESSAVPREASGPSEAVGGAICRSHGLAVLVTHVNDGQPCSDYFLAARPPQTREGSE